MPHLDGSFGIAMRSMGIHSAGVAMGIGEVISSPSSPWQNPYAERLIGSIRRECLDHMIVRGERHLRRVLARSMSYYHRARTRDGRHP
jgi:transposase InsO family protein